LVHIPEFILADRVGGQPALTPQVVESERIVEQRVLADLEGVTQYEPPGGCSLVRLLGFVAVSFLEFREGP
jgi:hypothetical protein